MGSNPCTSKNESYSNLIISRKPLEDDRGSGSVLTALCGCKDLCEDPSEVFLFSEQAQVVR